MALPETQQVYILFFSYTGCSEKHYMGVFDGEDKAWYYADVCVQEAGMRREGFSIKMDHVKTQLSVY